MPRDVNRGDPEPQADTDGSERIRRRNELALSFDWIAYSMAKQYALDADSFDDVLQVARIGLLKAAESYDPQQGPFEKYAFATARGFAKHYLRDCQSFVRIPREILVEVLKEPGSAMYTLYRPLSLEAYKNYGEGEGDHGLDENPALACEDLRLDRIGRWDGLHKAIDELPSRLKEVILDRYFHNLSQAQVAKKLRVSQTHVSRLERQALKLLKEALVGGDQNTRTVPHR